MHRHYNTPMEQSQYLRSMGIGEILDSAVRLYRKNFFVLIAAQLPLTVYYLVYNVSPFADYESALGMLEGTESDILAFLLRFLIILLLLIVIETGIVYPLTLSAVTRIASDRALQHPTSIKDAYWFSLRNWWKLGLTNLITTSVLLVMLILIIFIPFAILLSIFVGFATPIWVIGAIALIGLIIVLILSVIPLFFWVRWQLAFPVMVTERQFIISALRRSWNLVKGNSLKVLVIMVLMYLIPTVIRVSPFIMESLLGISLPVLTVASTIVVQGILMPLVHCTRVIVYFELRARTEGLDLEQKIEHLTDDS